MAEQVPPQVPPQLMEKINLAYTEMTRIRKIVVEAKDKIEEVESWDTCVDIAEKATSEVVPILDSQVLEDPYDTLNNMAPAMQGQLPIILRRKLNASTTVFRDIINGILGDVLNTRNKAEMNEAFTDLITQVMIMESKWAAIHDYATLVPQEAPREERTRGGRKHRTHRKRTRRARTHRKRTHRRRTHRK
jgi:hypothetical protein